MHHSSFHERAERKAVWYGIDNPEDYWRGRVVSTERLMGDGLRFGHILSFSRSESRELIIKVIWEDGRKTEIHPGNLTLH